MARLPIGQRIRDTRKEKGLTQSSLATAVGISASYLNLIEHDKRLIGGALLGRIAQALDVGVARLSGDDDAPLAQNMLEIVRAHALDGIEERHALQLVANTPEWARAVIDLHRKHQDATESVLALSDRLSQDTTLMELSHAVLNQITSIRSFAEILEGENELTHGETQRFSTIIAEQSDRLGSSARTMINLLSGPADDSPQFTAPEREVDDFIIRNNNHFPTLEAAAHDLHRTLFGDAEASEVVIVEELTRNHGFEVPARSHEVLPHSTVRFRRAKLLIELAFKDLLDALTADERLTTPEARVRARHALANYGASALLFPYEPFLEEAEAYRYDIERLSLRFRGSFEQIAHRLVTLRKPGAEGVPFSFLRADPAGNLSKPFSTQGLPMPRLGSACPLWAIYAAFASPDRTIAQLAEMPGGEQYLFIARRLSKGDGIDSNKAVQPMRVYSVMLGCDASYAERVVYADSMSASHRGSGIPVGFTCRSCSRANCRQRAQSAIRTA